MTSHRPRFITFTGVDDDTSLSQLHILAGDYPVEFGVLFSPRHQGSGGRYPEIEKIRALLNSKGRMQLAAHLCGAYSRTLIERRVIEPPARALVSMFDRLQVNTVTEHPPVRQLGAWAAERGQRLILQCRDEFPSAVTEVAWLFDRSGGTGKAPERWPVPASRHHANAVLKGYAGGIDELNVSEAVQAIGEHDSNYWIDMETGARDERDRFSVEKCRAVCRAVYG